MKATPTLKQTIVEKCLKNVWQLLLIMTLIVFLSTIPTSHGGYLMTGDSGSPASRDKSESEYDHTLPVYFQGVQDIVAVQPTIEWDKTIGGSGPESLGSIILTPDGGYLLAGSSGSNASGDKSENNKGGGDYWIVKIDAQGNKIWDKTIGGGRFDGVSSAIPTGDGGYLLAGSSDSNASGDKSEDSKGQIDYWVVKIDAQGNKIWDKTLGGSSYDALRSTIPTPDGGFLLAGDSNSPASGDKSENPKGGCDEDGNCDVDYWIVKIDAQGNKIWDKTLGGSQDEELSSALPTPDGGFLLAGDSYSSASPASGDKSENGKGGSDYWIVKIDAQGNKIWDKTIGGRDDDELGEFGIAIPTLDGGFLLAGSSRSNASFDKSENSKGFQDYWIVKIDAQGNKVWDKTLGGSSFDWLNRAIPTPDGGYLLAGDSASPASGDKSENPKGGCNQFGICEWDSWIVKIDAQGNKVWDKTLGGSGVEAFPRALLTPDGGYLLAVDSNSPASGDKSENSKGESDYWIVKLKDHTTPIVTSLTLIDAQTDQEIQELKNGDIISLADVGNGLLNIRANISAAQIHHVKLQLQGPVRHTKVEKQFPYTLFGDSQGDYAGRQLPAGRYTLKVTPYNKGKKGIALTVSFEVVKDIVAVQPTIEWDKTLGGNGLDGFSSAISTFDGGYLLAGTSSSNASGDKSENSKGVEDYWVVKTDAQGNKVWDKTLGGSDTDLHSSVIPTPDGGYLLAGWSDSPVSGDKSEHPKGGCDEEGHCDIDYWIVKTDAQGNKQWDKTFGGNSADFHSSAISTPDGGYLLAGESYSDASGDKSENRKGLNDYWVVKIDALGNKVWDKTLGGSGFEELRSVTPTADGGYLLAGYSSSNASGDKSENSKGTFDYWVVKIDANGNKVWDKTLGGSSHDYLHSIISTPDGGYLLAGESRSNASGDKSENSKGLNDYWVVKIDVNGNKVWDKTIGGSSNDYLHSTILTSDGGYLLAGSSISNASGDKSENSKGGADYWVVKIDALGNKVWEKTIGGESSDVLFNSISTSDGGYLLAGTSSSNASGDKSENSRGNSDYWIVKLKDQNAPVVTSLTLMNVETDQEISDFTPEATARQVKVYPLPTSSVINILHEGLAEEAHLMLLDFNGNMLLHQPMSQQPVEQVDLSGFKKGIYYLRVVSAEGVQVFRVARE